MQMSYQRAPSKFEYKNSCIFPVNMVTSHEAPKISRRRHDASKLQDITPPTIELRYNVPKHELRT